MDDLVYHFGRCELCIGTRQLLVEGKVQALEPRAYDLLAYLLRHRDRTISKDELLDEVWLGRIVSVGALARAATTVRKAIGCTERTRLIRTVHKTGYRFAAEVRETTTAAPASTPAADPLTVALLPFENLTGDLSLDWATIGLMALVGNALATNPRLEPLTVHDVAIAMQRLDPTTPMQQRVEALRRGVGASHVVHTAIFREAQGYRLDYRVLGVPGDPAGTLYASDLVRLGRALARHLLRELLPGTGNGADAFTLHDPWAMQLLARAMQASSDQSWKRALLMLRVVLALEPNYHEARRELSRLEALATQSAVPPE